MSNTVTVTETWIHADACPFIVTAKCSVCQAVTAELSRVRQFGNLEPDVQIFCRECAGQEIPMSGKVVEIGWVTENGLVKRRL